MYRVKYLPSADKDIQEAEAQLEQFSTSAADTFAEAILEKMANLIGFPFMYPISEYDDELRSISLPYKYLLFYRVDEVQEVIQVYRILHGMRDLPNVL